MGMSCIIRIEIKDRQIKEIVETLHSWYGLIMKPQRVRELLKEHADVAWQIQECGFDTVVREEFLNVVAGELTGLSWPTNGDSSKTKMRFDKAIRIAVKTSYTDIKLAERFSLLD